MKTFIFPRMPSSSEPLSVTLDDLSELLLNTVMSWLHSYSIKQNIIEKFVSVTECLETVWGVILYVILFLLSKLNLLGWFSSHSHKTN